MDWNAKDTRRVCIMPASILDDIEDANVPPMLRLASDLIRIPETPNDDFVLCIFVIFEDWLHVRVRYVMCNGESCEKRSQNKKCACLEWYQVEFCERG